MQGGLGDQDRSIPACAGEPGLRCDAPGTRSVYPRVCGGTSTPRSRPEPRVGLSPRVRGNLGPFREKRRGAGSIPACAGEPRGRRADTRGRAVYPRVCGGTRYSGGEDRMMQGLSPRVRGNLAARHDIAEGRGSIPACAGEPRRRLRFRRTSRVYPRVCGGTRGAIACPRSGCGLSPRVRGNRSMSRGTKNRGRSIPACAGEPGQP